MSRGIKQPRSGERGAILVEFAIVAWIFLIVMFGVFECARLMLVYATVTNSARIGARAAIVNGSLSGGGADIVGLVKDYAAAATLKRDDVAVNVAYAPNNNPGSTVQVEVSYRFEPLPFIPIGPLTLSASTQGVVTY